VYINSSEASCSRAQHTKEGMRNKASLFHEKFAPNREAISFLKASLEVIIFAFEHGQLNNR
jgi:hypothetical protein